MKATIFGSQMALPEIGSVGQAKLANSSVLCIGLGGLASAMLPYLTAAGVGRIGLVDGDTVAIHNLHRQLMYRLTDVGAFKAQVAQSFLQAIWPEVNLKAYPIDINENNISNLIFDYDIVIDATDNFAAHLLINDACCQQGKKFVLGAVSRYQGYCMSVVPPDTPCLRCFLGKKLPNHFPTCQEEGVLGMVPGIIGLCQASEVIKLLLDFEGTLKSRVLWVDVLKMKWKDYQLKQDPTCELCVKHLPFSQLSRPLSSMRCTSAPTHFDEISYQELCEIIENQKDTLLVDVRMPEEHARFNIGGECFPLPEMIFALEHPEVAKDHTLLNADKKQTVIVYCQKGIRSQLAKEKLLSFGFTTVYSLKNGVSLIQDQCL